MLRPIPAARWTRLPSGLTGWPSATTGGMRFGRLHSVRSEDRMADSEAQKRRSAEAVPQKAAQLPLTM